MLVDYVKQGKNKYMKTTIKFNDTDYVIDKLLILKNQGTTIDTDIDSCERVPEMIISDKIARPIVVFLHDRLLMVAKPNNMGDDVKNFSATLLSKHTLKKAKVQPLPEPAIRLHSDYRSHSHNDSIRHNGFDKLKDLQPRSFHANPPVFEERPQRQDNQRTYQERDHYNNRH